MRRFFLLPAACAAMLTTCEEFSKGRASNLFVSILPMPGKRFGTLSYEACAAGKSHPQFPLSGSNDRTRALGNRRGVERLSKVRLQSAVFNVFLWIGLQPTTGSSASLCSLGRLELHEDVSERKSHFASLSSFAIASLTEDRSGLRLFCTQRRRVRFVRLAGPSTRPQSR